MSCGGRGLRWLRHGRRRGPREGGVRGRKAGWLHRHGLLLHLLSGILAGDGRHGGDPVLSGDKAGRACDAGIARGLGLQEGLLRRELAGGLRRCVGGLVAGLLRQLVRRLEALRIRGRLLLLLLLRLAQVAVVHPGHSRRRGGEEKEGAGNWWMW